MYNKAAELGLILDKHIESACMTDLLQAAINSGVRVVSVEVNGGWVEVDTVKDMKSKTTAARLRMIDLAMSS